MTERENGYDLSFVHSEEGREFQQTSWTLQTDRRRWFSPLKLGQDHLMRLRKVNMGLCFQHLRRVSWIAMLGLGLILLKTWLFQLKWIS